MYKGWGGGGGGGGGVNKFKLTLLLSDEFNKRAEDWFLIENYLKWLHPSSHLVFVATYFLACDFEKLMLVFWCPAVWFYKRTSTSMPILETLELDQSPSNQKLLTLSKVPYEGFWFNPWEINIYLLTIYNFLLFLFIIDI